MEQEYFYLTITGDGDAHAIKESMNLGRSFKAWNKGERLDNHPRLQAKEMCLYFETSRNEYSLDHMFTGHFASTLLKFPKHLQKTVHFICQSSYESQSHGCFIEVDRMKNMALINADFMFHSKLYALAQHHEFPFTQVVDIEDKKPVYDYGYAHFTVGAYHYTLDDISAKLGFKHNHRSFNFSDIRKSSKKPYGFTSWDYKSSLDEQAPIAEHIEYLVNELYAYKTEILELGNEIDIYYGMSVTGHMPNEYEFHISSDTIRKLAEMRISLDFDMYFLNNY